LKAAGFEALRVISDFSGETFEGFIEFRNVNELGEFEFRSSSSMYTGGLYVSRMMENGKCTGYSASSGGLVGLVERIALKQYRVIGWKIVKPNENLTNNGWVKM